MNEREHERRPVQRALISVYDKTGLTELAQVLREAGVEIVSTGSTAAHLEAAGVPVTRVEAVTGFPECLDGRVKTLHPAVHAGLLADVRLDKHRSQLDGLGIAPFQLLVSNLYPFGSTVASGAEVEDCVEQIDIGGPAMVRAAAKNHANVAVLTAPSDYAAAIEGVRGGGFTLDERRRLAARAFAHTAAYDVAVARWCAQALAPPLEHTAPGASCWPEFAGMTGRLRSVLRYGENPHQAAALYTAEGPPPGLAQARQLAGKEMSYNNYVDADAAWRSCHDFTEPTVAIIKHANPCGLAIGADLAEAHRKAHACDPVSAFGGVIAANGEVTVELAHQIAEIFTEVVVAPSYADGAAEILAARKNLRILLAPEWNPMPAEVRLISGGILTQVRDGVDTPGDEPEGWKLVTGPAAGPELLADLWFAWRAVRSVKSNAILLARAGATVGVGMGQVNRVDSARLAVARAGDRVVGSAAASDAFFPFADGLEVLRDAGVAAVVQPGGSKRDDDVIAAAAAAGMTMYVTGTRHFFH